MDVDDDAAAYGNNKQYVALRSDLIAALLAFDRAQDWADLIHDLQRVNRVFLKHANSSYLPEKHLLAKRLAQCLTSSLPSGVHLKALETYRLVFSRIGMARLARDLPLYAGGLFPLLAYSATSLKPTLLALYETHFIPLGPALSPALDGFVLAILSGLEDETSEFYERSVTLLDSLAIAINDDENFARALWRALLLSPPMRLPAVNFIRARFASDAKSKWSGQLLTDVPLVSHAIASALSDKNALVQRSVLDLLLGELSLNLSFFGSDGDDFRAGAVALMRGVFGALLRRDVSLTKRVHSWLMGGKDGTKAEDYFNRYSKALVLDAIDCEINHTLTAAQSSSLSAGQVTGPCKIMTALLDRSELFTCIASALTLRSLRYARLATLDPSAPYSRDVRYSLSEMIAQLDNATIFGELERVIMRTIEIVRLGSDGTNEHHDVFEVMSFALTFIPVEDDVTWSRQLIALLKVVIESLESISHRFDMLMSAMSFCTNALAGVNLKSRLGNMSDRDISNLQEAGTCFSSFFMGWLAVSVRSAPSHIRCDFKDIDSDSETRTEFAAALMREDDDRKSAFAKEACAFLTKLILLQDCPRETLENVFQASAKCTACGDPRISVAGVHAYASIASKLRRNGLPENSEAQSNGVLRQTWRLLHPSLSTASAQQAQAWLLLQRQFPGLASRVVSDGILSPITSRRLRNLERFVYLWRMAHQYRMSPLPADSGLFLMLDALDDREWAPKMLARSWLADALVVNPSAVLDGPLRLLLIPEANVLGEECEFRGVYDVHRSLYAFQLLRSILESSVLGSFTNTMIGFNVDGSDAYDAHDAHGGFIEDLRHGNAERLQAGMNSLATTQPSARVLSALISFAAKGEQRKDEWKSDGPEIATAGLKEVTTERDIPVKQFFPVLDYISALALTALGYLRGKSSSKSSKQSPCQAAEQFSVHDSPSPCSLIELTDTNSVNDLEWEAAGLGYRPFCELHGEVVVAAAEFLAKLVTSCPRSAFGATGLVHRLVDPVVALLGKAVADRDFALQLHYLEIVESLFISEKFAHSPVKSADVELMNLGSGNDATASEFAARSHSRSSFEANCFFLPSILAGLSQAYKNFATENCLSSQEVLGLRRRWIQFVGSIVKYSMSALPQLTDGVIIIIIKLLNDYKENTVAADVTCKEGIAFQRYSRADECLLLLKGLSSILSTISMLFDMPSTTNNFSGVASKPNLADSRLHGDSMNSDSQLGSDFSIRPGRHIASVNDPSREHGSADGRSFDPLIHAQPQQHALSAAQAQGLSASRNQSYGQEFQTSASTMINSINPLRMLNDFVKDVFIGVPSEISEVDTDPRKGAIRLMYLHLPDIMRSIVPLWASTQCKSATSHASEGISGDVVATNIEGPRLSSEVPRERSQTQRSALVDILRPLFVRRPTDVIAAIVTMFMDDTDGSLPDDIIFISSTSELLCRAAVDMLRSFEGANLEIVVPCARELIITAMKWDKNNNLSLEDGQNQLNMKVASTGALKKLAEDGYFRGPDTVSNVGNVTSQTVSRIKVASSASAIDFGVKAGGGGSQSGNRATTVELVNAGDFLAAHSSGEVELGTLRFLVMFLRNYKDADVNTVWFAVHALARDVLAMNKRKESVPLLLNLLSSFSSCCTVSNFDKKHQRELMQLTSTVSAACSAMAAGSIDFTVEPRKSSDEILKSRIAYAALHAIANALPPLIDFSFLEDKTQLSSTVHGALSPALATLRGTAFRAAAFATATDSKIELAAEPNERHGEIGVNDRLSLVCADILLEIARRDWGTKIVRREIIAVLDDPNFFHGKRGLIMRKLAAVVDEVIGSGGASTLLASIGSTAPISSTGIPGLFTSRDSETLLRARAVRRIAFCVFESNADHYLPQLPGVLERLRDSLRLGEPLLFVECFLCLRVLLLKTGSSSISAFRATILSEMFRIATNPTKNLDETLAALQYLDIVTLLSPPDFGYELCFFFSRCSEAKSINDENVEARYVPLVSRLANLNASEENGKISQNSYIRILPGHTVFSGRIDERVTVDFIREYARSLEIRNFNPALAVADPNYDVLKQELENEFVE